MVIWCEHGYGQETCPHCSSVILNERIKHTYSEIDTLRARIKELESALANAVSADFHNEKVKELEEKLSALGYKEL